jgi:HlyD family secretion protein
MHAMTSNQTFRALAAMLLIPLAACSAGENEASPQKEMTPRAVTTATVQLRQMSGEFATSGLLVAREEAAVGSELSGYRVAGLFADESDWVNRGQAMVRLDDTLLRSRIAQQRAAVAQAQAQAARAQGEADRVKGLDGEGILADEQIQQRRFEARSAGAAVDVQREQLKGLETEASRLIIRAPVSGMVLERTVRPGQIAGAGGEPMFRILRDGLVELAAEFPEDALRGVKAGMPARVIFPSGTEILGTVRIVSPRVDPQTKLAAVRIRLPRHDELRVGGFAKGVLQRDVAPVPAVPEKAVQFEAGGPVVTVIGADNRARRVSVKIGARANGWAELVEGPQPGTRVALGGGAFLLDGDPVALAPPASPSPARPAARGEPAR